MTLRTALVSSLIILVLALVAGPAFGDVIHQPLPWNGYKIYLSPSSQTGNDGCEFEGEPYNEATGLDGVGGAINIAHEAAAGIGFDLVARGFWVRIGDGTYWHRINASNTWDSDIHIPIHSNAPGGSWPCSSDDPLNSSASGTRVFYVSGNGHALANQLIYTIAPVSPGTGAGNEVASYNAIDETVYTNAWAAYLEAAFHTHYYDVRWLLEYNDVSDHWTWRIGWAVDRFLGYPPNIYW